MHRDSSKYIKHWFHRSRAVVMLTVHVWRWEITIGLGIYPIGYSWNDYKYTYSRSVQLVHHMGIVCIHMYYTY